MSALTPIVEAMNRTQLSIADISKLSTEEIGRLTQLHTLVIELDSRLGVSPDVEIKHVPMNEWLKDLQRECINDLHSSSPDDFVAAAPVESTPVEEADTPIQPIAAVYPCEFCGRSCGSKAGLSAHIRGSHKDAKKKPAVTSEIVSQSTPAPSTPAARKPFIITTTNDCPHCNRTCDSLEELKKHISIKHPAYTVDKLRSHHLNL